MSLFSRVTGGSGLTEEDHRFLKLYKVLVTEGRYALHLIFKWGCVRDETVPLTEYLEGMKMSKRDIKKCFRDSTMRDKMKSNPSGNEFDIALLYACIETTCSGLADKGAPEWEGKDHSKLESVCRCIKNLRNIYVHDPPVLADDAITDTKLQEIQDLIDKILTLGGVKYGRQPSEVNKIKMSVLDNINKIMNTSLDIKSIQQYQAEIKDLRDMQKNKVLNDGKSELFSKYKNMSKIDPASFISGRERLQVAKVFTRLEVTRNQANNTSYWEDVDYDSLLDLTTEDGSKPIITVVEGEAGAGKTTLAKLILDKWMSQNASGDTSTFQGLQTYDLVLYAEARNKSISSFLSLLTVLMSQASYYLFDDDLLKSVLNLNVLLIIDGLDELNTASERLIKNISDEHIPRSNGKLHLLITTRPNMLPDLPTLLPNQSTVHTRLKGITQENRVEFVLKLHNEMITENLSNQDTQELVDFMKQSESRLGEHFRLPLNLTLLTYLWASDPQQVNSLTTATGLYIALQEMIITRLSTRIKDHNGSVEFPTDKLKNLCEEFLKCLYDVCLETHSRGHMQLSSDSIKELENKSNDLKLPFNEMCSAFLAAESEWTAKGYKIDLFVPHKSIMEFYAAYGIMLDIIESNNPQSFKDEIEEICRKLKLSSKIQSEMLEEKQPKSKSLSDILKTRGIDLNSDKVKASNYQNVFLHLSGLLAHKHRDDLKTYANELVAMLKEAKMKDSQWLDLVVETRCDDQMAVLIAKEITKQLVVRDGHTGAALKMFGHLEPNIPVQIILENEVCYIPQLDELLDELSGRKCQVEFFLRHQWKHREYGTSDKLLQRLTSGTGHERCRVYRFTGNLEHLQVLPTTIDNLRITLTCNEHATAICSELATLVRKQQLLYLGVHVMAGVSPESLIPLPVIKAKNGECGTLWISDVRDDMVDQACQVIRALLPPGGLFEHVLQTVPERDVATKQH
ncbi:uncharacterized protein [Procambarus clarkii]|uniref:uncharacterized protein isoform X2 n=1 Tax=Procambarus clarkii TaxID=6728 RepID=UPI00374351A4